MHVQALVLTPTRELCVQVTEEIRASASSATSRAVAIYGGSSMDRQIERASSAGRRSWSARRGACST